MVWLGLGEGLREDIEKENRIGKYGFNGDLGLLHGFGGGSLIHLFRLCPSLKRLFSILCFSPTSYLVSLQIGDYRED